MSGEESMAAGMSEERLATIEAEIRGGRLAAWAFEGEDSSAARYYRAMVDLLAEVRRLQYELGTQTISLDAEATAQLETCRLLVEARLELAAMKDRRCETCGKGLGWMRYPGPDGLGWCRWLSSNTLAAFSCAGWTPRQATKDGETK